MEKPSSITTSVQDDGLPTIRRLRPLHSIVRHWWIAAGLAAITAVAGGYYLLKLHRPVYYAESLFMVLPVTKTPSDDREAPLPRYNEFVNQQLLFVTREDVCLEALESMGEGRAAWMDSGESMRDAAARLSVALKVNRVTETSYVSVGLYSSRHEGLVDVVNAVMKAYLERAKVQTLYGLDIRSEALTRRAVELTEEIKGKAETLGSMTKELGLVGLDTVAAAPLLGEPDRTAREAQNRRLEAEARLAGIDARYKILREANTAEHAVLVADAELIQLRNVLLVRKSELKAKLFGLTAQHEGRKSIESEIAEIDAELAREEKKALERQIRMETAKLEESRGNETASAQAELAAARRAEQVIHEQTDADRERMIRLYPQAQALKLELDRLRNQLQMAQERIDAMRLETKTPGYVQLSSSAALTEIPPGKRVLKGAVILGALALVFIVGVPVGMDLVSNRVRQDSDVQGAVISIPHWGSAMTSDLVVADQRRRVALALDRERRLHNRSAFIFTSVLPGAGTSQLVLDVARELGEFGVQALAVEANALKPDSRYRSNGHPGLAAGMSKGIRASELVNLAEGRFPDRIAVGPTDGKTTLTGLEKIDSFLGQVLGHYQMVLIDAPPVLMSADAEYLASRGQAVVLVVESERTPLSELNRATRILRQVGANVVLTVMNRARHWKDQGRKSSVTLRENP